MENEEYSMEMEKNMTEEKNALLMEFLELIKKTDSDPVRLARFNDPEWQENVTVENLKVLVKGNRELLDVQDKAFKILTPMTEEEKNIWQQQKDQEKMNEEV